MIFLSLHNGVALVNGGTIRCEGCEKLLTFYIMHFLSKVVSKCDFQILNRKDNFFRDKKIPPD